MAFKRSRVRTPPAPSSDVEEEGVGPDHSGANPFAVSCPRPRPTGVRVSCLVSLQVAVQKDHPLLTPSPVHPDREESARRRQTAPFCHCAKLCPVGTVMGVPQVLDYQGTCVVLLSTVPHCHRILFPAPFPARRAPARNAPTLLAPLFPVSG